jgi:N4-(beta-N-acetylglucosaminyl)-L-asparaginase
MEDAINRRMFLQSTAAVTMASLAVGAEPKREPGPMRPMVASSNPRPDVINKVMELLKEGYDPLDAAIVGVSIVEADPTDHSVGYGGMPNEDGVVELDAAVMHGPTHGGGAVASIRNILHPAAVARLVMKRSKHCLIVGEGALRFAKAHGFPEMDMLTEEARKGWLAWKERNTQDWLPPKPGEEDPKVLELLKKRITGTIHISALDTHGNLGCVTTTSGLAFKIPGRVGDSPILGAGLYLDNTVGSCGSVGLGELNLLNCASYLIIEDVRRGKSMKDAVVMAGKRIAETCTRDRRWRTAEGKLNSGVSFFGLTKDGKVAGASVGRHIQIAVHDGDRARLLDCEDVLA